MARKSRRKNPRKDPAVRKAVEALRRFAKKLEGPMAGKRVSK